MNEWMGVKMSGYIGGWKNGLIGCWNRKMDEWADGLMNGKKEARVDGRKEK